MSEVSCAHNAPGQVLIPGQKTQCRKCGSLIEPAPEAVNAANVVGQQKPTMVYPGGGHV